MGAFAATKADPNPDPAKKSASESIKNSALGAASRFHLHMPPQTNADVLRRHGFLVLADWAENALIAPRYLHQSQYWASVLWEPEIPDFAEWDMDDAREFQYEPELPFGDVPAHG